MSLFILLSFSITILCSRVSDSTITSCTSPINIFQSGQVTLYGPCPSDIVVIPDGAVGEFRCDYKSVQSVTAILIWNVSLFDSPIIQFRAIDKSVTVIYSFNTEDLSGYSLLKINTSKVYDLNNGAMADGPIMVQCGTCTVMDNFNSCLNKETGNKNFANSSQLVTFGSPCCLGHFHTGLSMTLYWSAPNNTGSLLSLNYIYEVVLEGTTPEDIISFTTTDTYIELALNDSSPLPHSILCYGYSWSVTASLEGKQSSTVYGGDGIIKQAIAPPIVNILSMEPLTAVYCNNSLSIRVDVSVISLQPLDLIDYTVTIDSHHVDPIMVVDPEAVTVVPSIIKVVDDDILILEAVFIDYQYLPVMDSPLDLTVIVDVSNTCGRDSDIIDSLFDVMDCHSSPSQSNSITSSTTSTQTSGYSTISIVSSKSSTIGQTIITSNGISMDQELQSRSSDIQNRGGGTSYTIAPTGTIKPDERSRDTRSMLIIIILSCVLAVMILGCIIIVLVFVIKRTVTSKSKRSDAYTIRRGSTPCSGRSDSITMRQIDSSNNLPVPSEYAIPITFTDGISSNDTATTSTCLSPRIAANSLNMASLKCTTPVHGNKEQDRLHYTESNLPVKSIRSCPELPLPSLPSSPSVLDTDSITVNNNGDIIKYDEINNKNGVNDDRMDLLPDTSASEGIVNVIYEKVN